MIQFRKMHGLGNDFMVVDAINQSFHPDVAVIRKLADRRLGIGFDQLLLVERALTFDIDFQFTIFNADGSKVTQCGNGARCFARFVFEKGLTDKRKMLVSTQSTKMTLDLVRNDYVSVDMGEPIFIVEKIPVQQGVTTFSFEGEEYTFCPIGMGNPHAIIWLPHVEDIDIEPLAGAMQSSEIFPDSVNVGFAQKVSDSVIKLRVYERGAGETYACGSGACAAVVSGIQKKILSANVAVELRGGRLDICWNGIGQSVIMSGEATNVYDGTIDCAN